VNNAIIAATRRARIFQAAETINPFDAPSVGRSALHEFRQRRPRPRPGTTVAIHDSTNGTAVLQRVFSEPDMDDQRRAVERDRKRRWRAARSLEQVGRDRTRDRDWRRIKRAGRRSAPRDDRGPAAG
jgi:hypothetical protein